MNTSQVQIGCVAELLDAIANSGLAGRKRSHLRLWFRGHAKGGWNLHPGVYRKEMKNEAARLLWERHLTQDFRIFSASLRNASASDEELYFIQQHYRMPTRLLDWTANPLAALYFAVSQLPDQDGEVFFMDAYELSTTQNAQALFEGIATSRNVLFREVVDKISDWKAGEAKLAKYIMPIRPDHFDQRISRQLAFFTLHGPFKQVLTPTENSTLKSFKVPGGKSKKRIHDELLLLGVNHYTVYGDLDHLADWIKDAHD